MGKREELNAGRLGEAVAIVGRPPVRARPRDGLLRLEWRPGRDRTLPLAGSGAAPGVSFAIDLAAAARGRSVAA